MKRVIGRVTETERDEIRTLFERRNGLNELIQILNANNTDLYEKVVTDIGETTTRFQTWWESKADFYAWESTPNGHWSIDFNTCEIYLEDN